MINELNKIKLKSDEQIKKIIEMDKQLTVKNQMILKMNN